MTNWGQESFSGGRQSSASWDVLPVWYSPPCDMSIYVRNFVSHVDALQFSLLLVPESDRSKSVGPEPRDTTAGVRQNWWMHGTRCSAMTLKVAGRDIISRFARCWERERNQQRKTALLALIRRRSTVPTVVGMDPRCLSKNPGCFYAVVKCAYWCKTFYLETHVRDQRVTFLQDDKSPNCSVCECPTI